jgi:hypothetical protein
MSKTIEIIISPKGETKLETKGFTGSNCQEASRAFEQALGAKTSEQLTPEYYAEPNTNHIETTN